MVPFPSVRRVDGRWRYERRPGRGIALSFERAARPAPSPAPARPPQKAPRSAGSGVRVLCYCGTSFSFEGPAAVCPHCAQLAEWPTMGLVEREMRADLDSLLEPHGRAD